ncbi:MAG: PEP-CTERM sorting domain-containing protein [Verrucomicrobiota bacterium JB022]|nr:PEP-CTERM sorting domain-containing protein [Verrucomicrobiota bacterium JB022]
MASFNLTRFAAVLLLSIAAHSTQAVTNVEAVIPPEFTDTEADATFGLFANTGRTYQAQYAASHLINLPIGTAITGLSMRTNGAFTSNLPGSDVTFGDFEITFAQAGNPLNAFSSTVADNMLNPSVVRSGAWTIEAGSFPGADDGQANAWGPLISFDSPYTYQGGDLVILIRHTGGNTSSAAPDAASYSVENGYWARWGATADATTITNTANVIVFNLHYTAVPEPSEMALIVALGGFACVAFRRLRRQ